MAVAGAAGAEAAGRPAIAAHRGGARLWAENSLTAFRGALGLGVDLVELDVHQTRDGEVVVVHDPTLERTTTGRGAVRDLTWAELTSVAIRETADERPPRLAEVLALLRPSSVGLLEIKTDRRGALSRHPGRVWPSSRLPGSPTGRRLWPSTGRSWSGFAPCPRPSA
jgi:glycerophosphoryl diester phosphodiesterase